MQDINATRKSTDTTEQQCPQCKATIPVHPHYVVWCDQCNWNLQTESADQPRDLLESLYTYMGKRSSQALFEQVVGAESVKPAWTLSRVRALALATLVHGLTLTFFIAGIVLLLKWWPNLFAIFGGVVCLGVALILLPRPARWPANVLPKENAPKLYEIADRVSRVLGTLNVDGIVVDESFGARFGQVGWRRRKVVWLGLPLLAILDDQEAIALIAHELAHDANGDPIRGFFIGTAVNALFEWHRFLLPDQIWPEGIGIYGLLMVPLNLIGLGLSHLVRLVAYGLVHLLWRDSQRTEYLADYLASRVSGTDAMLSLLEKLHFERSFAYTVQKVALKRDIGNMFDEFRQRIKAMPEHELERIRRLEKLQGLRLDVTHPPTVYRAELMKAHRVPERKAMLSPSDSDQLAQELAHLHAPAQKLLVDRYIASLH